MGKSAVGNSVPILVIDDDRLLADYAKTILEECGFIVNLAGNGEEGVKAAVQRHPGLILLDVSMPTIDGFEVLSRIRQDLRTRTIPVVMMTSRNQMRDVQRATQAGASGYIVKPVSAEPLINRLLKILRLPGKYEKNAPAKEVATSPRAAVPDDGLPERLPPFDIAAALLRASHNRQLLRKLIAGFGENFVDVAAELRRLLEAGSIDEVMQVAHRLKGVAGTLEAADLHTAANDLELACHQKWVGDLPALLAIVEAKLRPALAAARTLGLASTSSATVVPAVLLDTKAASVLAEDLGRLLESKNLAARRLFSSFQSVLAGHGYDRDLLVMSAAIDALNFPAARQELETICDRMLVSSLKITHTGPAQSTEDIST